MIEHIEWFWAFYFNLNCTFKKAINLTFEMIVDNYLILIAVAFSVFVEILITLCFNQFNILSLAFLIYLLFVIVLEEFDARNLCHSIENNDNVNNFEVNGFFRGRKNWFLNSPLHSAVKANRTEIVKLLVLKWDFDVDAVLRTSLGTYINDVIILIC